jgi:hypothetical protein
VTGLVVAFAIGWLAGYTVTVVLFDGLRPLRTGLVVNVFT